jgi:hypothetical protein
VGWPATQYASLPPCSLILHQQHTPAAGRMHAQFDLLKQRACRERPPHVHTQAGQPWRHLVWFSAPALCCAFTVQQAAGSAPANGPHHTCAQVEDLKLELAGLKEHNSMLRHEKGAAEKKLQHAEAAAAEAAAHAVQLQAKLQAAEQKLLDEEAAGGHGEKDAAGAASSAQARKDLEEQMAQLAATLETMQVREGAW